MYHPADGSWYRKYSDGWLEQGGIIAINNTDRIITATLLKAFKDTNYIVTFGAFIKVQGISAAHNKMPSIDVPTKKSTSFSFLNNGENVTGWYWHACGKSA